METKGQGFCLATNRFTFEDCVYLSNTLSVNYGLKPSVVKAGHTNQWKISIGKHSMSDLVSKGKPYSIDVMKYKCKGYL